MIFGARPLNCQAVNEHDECGCGTMMSHRVGKPIDILLVEDNPGDVRLTQEALKGGMICNELNIVGDGEEALDYLYKRSEYINASRPDIILLDLNMPKKTGQEVLAEIKNDPELKSIPVVVLTTSMAKEDMIKTYDLHANCYIQKPMNLEHFINIVHSIKDFWFNTVMLPDMEKEGSP